MRLNDVWLHQNDFLLAAGNFAWPGRKLWQSHPAIELAHYIHVVSTIINHPQPTGVKLLEMMQHDPQMVD